MLCYIVIFLEIYLLGNDLNTLFWDDRSQEMRRCLSPPGGWLQHYLTRPTVPPFLTAKGGGLLLVLQNIGPLKELRRPPSLVRELGNWGTGGVGSKLEQYFNPPPDSPSLTSRMKSCTVCSRLTPWKTTGLKFRCSKERTRRTVITASPAMSRWTPRCPSARPPPTEERSKHGER